MTLLLDLVIIPKVRTPVADQELEKTQTQSSQEDSITETIGSDNVHYIPQNTVEIISIY